ncbi:MFS transporter [Streptosporangium fragile]|uniref:MFS transporter n=1 Tax=Streptosporangium fragile TaxID=46186 RepID=A0ABN3VYH3_9ACTN
MTVAQRRTLAVLSSAQITGGVGVAVGLSFSSLTVEALSGSTALSGLAGTATVLGAAVLALPTARSSGRGGRRAGLTLAYGCALFGCLIAVLAISVGSWQLLLGGLVLFGGASAGNLAARYSATDLSPPGHAARHLSLVVWASTIGAVAGPNLAGPAERLSDALGLARSNGPFLLAAAAFTIVLAVVVLALRPDPLLLARSVAGTAGPRTTGPGPTGPTGPTGPRTAGSETAGSAAAGKAGGTLRTAWRVLRGAPAARRALAAIAVSHTAMVSIMTMTPVHLSHGGATYTVIGIVISLHIAGMYVLSPVVGWLADRAGRVRVLVLGMGLLLTAAVLAGGAGAHGVTQVTTGLTLLGLGWSCGLIAGSAMLTEAAPLEHRPAVQGLSDMLMNACGATGTVVAGVIAGGLSYGVLGGAVAVMTGATGVWLALRGR